MSTTDTTNEYGDIPLLETQNLTKKFEGLTAVDDINIRISEGEIRCLIGPNGAGKSTFMKLLVGEHEPTAGTIKFKGEDITGFDPHRRVRRGMSMKFQVPAVYTDLSVRQNMRIAVQRHASKGTLTSRIDEVLSQFNLRSESDKTVDNLAHGQQQWVEIAMAMVIEPDLLLLDEPTAGMSIEETAKTADLIREISAERPITFVVIEHDIDFVRNIAGDNLVTVLYRGSVFKEGTIDDIADDPDVQRIYLGEERE